MIPARNGPLSLVLCWSLMTGLLSFSFLACDGDGEEKKDEVHEILPGVSGKVCLSAHAATVTDGQTGEARTTPIADEPFAKRYRTGIGGQIRGIASYDSLGNTAKVITNYYWGGGAAIRSGTNEGIKQASPLDRWGSVTDLQLIENESLRALVFATEEGYGLINVNGDGSLAPREELFHRSPAGIIAVDVSKNAEVELISLVTDDGYVLLMKRDEFQKADGCADILTASPALKEGETLYRPIDVELFDGKALVLATRRGATTSLAPQFAEALVPLFQSMVEGKQGSIVRAVDIASHGIIAMGFEARDESFKGFGRFFPTGIAIEGKSLYATGLVYDEAAVTGFLNEKCTDKDLVQRILCLSRAAQDGSLLALKTVQGLSALGGGFFVYRNLDDLSRPDHFEWIPLTTSRAASGMAPLIFKIAVAGEQAFLRAPNFLTVLKRGDDPATKKEKWTVTSSFDAASGLAAGLPLQMSAVQTPKGRGVAMAIAGFQRSDGTGESALELFLENGEFSTLDRGSVLSSIEGGNGREALIIERRDAHGGDLLLHDLATRKPVNVLTTVAAPRVIAAHLLGSDLAFVWSEAPTRDRPRPAWRIVVQQGARSEGRGELVVSREGGSGHYDGFPSLQGLTIDEALRARSVADVQLRGNHAFVLYEGKAGDRAYHQLGIYRIGTNNALSHVGITSTVDIQGQGIDRGKILFIEEQGGTYDIAFAGGTAISRASLTPGRIGERPAAAQVRRLLTSPQLIDATCDALGGNLCAYLEGFTVHLVHRGAMDRDRSALAIPKAAGNTLDKLIGGQLAFLGGKLFVSTPNGAEAGLFQIDVGNDGTAPAATPLCASCAFTDIAAFQGFPTDLFANSPSRGVQLFRIGD